MISVELAEPKITHVPVQCPPCLLPRPVSRITLLQNIIYYSPFKITELKLEYFSTSVIDSPAKKNEFEFAALEEIKKTSIAIDDR